MSISFDTYKKQWSVDLEVNKKRYWIGCYEEKEEAILIDRLAIENSNQFTNIEHFRLLLQDKSKARKLFKENINSEVSGLLSDKREYLPLLVRMKGEIASFGYVHRKDIDDAIRIIRQNKTLSIRDISMVMGKTIRKIPKAKLSRIQYTYLGKCSHILYLDSADLDKWQNFISENKDKGYTIEEIKQKFKETFFIVDLSKDEGKKLDKQAIAFKIEQVEAILQSLKQLLE